MGRPKLPHRSLVTLPRSWPEREGSVSFGARSDPAGFVYASRFRSLVS